MDLGVAEPLGVCWAPAGNRMYVPLSDKTVRVYDPNSGGHVATLAGHADWVYGVALSPDGSRLATAGADGTVKLWHTGENRLLATLVQATPRAHRRVAARRGHRLSGRRFAARRPMAGGEPGRAAGQDSGHCAERRIARNRWRAKNSRHRP